MVKNCEKIKMFYLSLSVNNLHFKHIRAKLLMPQQEDACLSINSLENKAPLRAIMPPPEFRISNDMSSSMTSSITNLSDSSEILNDFAIDITHIEKLVQDTDLILIEKKLSLLI